MTDAGFEFAPVVIIGAGRSGTNILRDSLTALPGFGTWDCDEINPIWRHGNVSWPDDMIPPERATPSVRSYIRRCFERIWHQKGRPDYVVEKTCANSLRVPFVDAVLPECKYIYLVRDGTDIVPSAAKRWRGDLEFPGLPYLLAKARYAPLGDLPRYGWGFVSGRLGMMSGRDSHLTTWGPRVPGMEQLEGHALELLCAHQWCACIEAADAAFATMAQEKVLKIYYEDLTADPVRVLNQIICFLDATPKPDAVSQAVTGVRQSPPGRGRQLLGPTLGAVLNTIGPTLAKHGYKV